MGTFQQVTIGAICLVAAFAFGSFINQQPNDLQPATSLAEVAGEEVRSLIEPDLVVEKRPAKTPWMKPNLAARLPMPSLPEATEFDGRPPLAIDDSQFEKSQFASPVGGSDIPPPSDLTGRFGGVRSSELVAGEVIEAAPDFSGGLNAVSSMPVVSDRRSGRGPNMVDQLKAKDEPLVSMATIDKAPVFNAPNNSVARGSRGSFQVNDSNASTSNSGSRWGIAAAEKDLVSVGREGPETLVAAPRSLQREPAQFVNRKSNEGLARSVLNSSHASGLVPLPSLGQESTLATAIEIVDPSAAFRGTTMRDERASSSRMAALDARGATSTAVLRREASVSEPSFGQNNQRRVARLPFTLNATARTRLTRLRDETIEKITLSTTKFTDHVVADGESLQAIATRYFGKPDFYLDIYMANRDRLKFPGDIRDGMVIKVPIYQ